MEAYYDIVIQVWKVIPVSVADKRADEARTAGPKALLSAASLARVLC